MWVFMNLTFSICLLIIALLCISAYDFIAMDSVETASSKRKRTQRCTLIQCDCASPLHGAMKREDAEGIRPFLTPNTYSLGTLTSYLMNVFSQAQRPQIAELLLERGADPNFKGWLSQKVTDITHLIKTDPERMENAYALVRVLISYGMRINSEDSRVMALIDAAITGNLERAIAFGDIRTTRTVLMQRRNDPALQGAMLNALDYAVGQGHAALVGLLLIHGVCPHRGLMIVNSILRVLQANHDHCRVIEDKLEEYESIQALLEAQARVLEEIILNKISRESTSYLSVLPSDMMGQLRHYLYGSGNTLSSKCALLEHH